MEDISRELEREIAQTKPKPYKQDRKTRILIIDDFGKMKSGEYLKKLVAGLSIAGGICFVAAVVLFFLYSGLSGDTGEVKSRLSIAEKKVEELTREKEVLMARLVISGKEPGISGVNEKKQSLAAAKVVEKKPLLAKKQDIKPSVEKVSPKSDLKPTTSAVAPKKQPKPTSPKEKIKPQLNASTDSDQASAAPTAELPKKMVSIEKFTVVKDGNNGDLLVRFDIRNISTSPGDVSGRIFTVLKPDDKPEDQWLVVPSSKLKNGIPITYRKGQYFSIAHFKPVKFRIKNQASPDFFQKASIYIFNSQGDVMFEKLIDITEAQ